MDKEHQFEILIGQVLRMGLFVAIFTVLIGGVLYLFQNGEQIINYNVFNTQGNSGISILDILYKSFSFAPRDLILLGLFLLMLTQVLRVALTVWLFVRLKDAIFTGISFAILVVLMYSVLKR